MFQISTNLKQLLPVTSLIFSRTTRFERNGTIFNRFHLPSHHPQAAFIQPGIDTVWQTGLTGAGAVRNEAQKTPKREASGNLERMVRIELTTCSLRMSCSAFEPHQHIFDSRSIISGFAAFCKLLFNFFARSVRNDSAFRTEKAAERLLFVILRRFGQVDVNAVGVRRAVNARQR